MGCIFKDANCFEPCHLLSGQLHLEPKPTRLSGADSRTAKALSFPCGAAARDGIAGGNGNGKVTGIGGFFFRAKDPKALGSWYQQHLGISLTPIERRGVPFGSKEAGPTVSRLFLRRANISGMPKRSGW